MQGNIDTPTNENTIDEFGNNIDDVKSNNKD